jgi:hypothetical protein
MAQEAIDTVLPYPLSYVEAVVCHNVVCRFSRDCIRSGVMPTEENSAGQMTGDQPIGSGWTGPRGDAHAAISPGQ